MTKEQFIEILNDKHQDLWFGYIERRYDPYFTNVQDSVIKAQLDQLEKIISLADKLGETYEV